MSSTPKEIVSALVEALKASNKYMDRFMTESPELCSQFEENEELIQIVEPDLEHMTGPIVIDNGVLRCEKLYVKELVITKAPPVSVPDGSVIAEEIHAESITNILTPTI